MKTMRHHYMSIRKANNTKCWQSLVFIWKRWRYVQYKLKHMDVYSSFIHLCKTVTASVCSLNCFFLRLPRDWSLFRSHFFNSSIVYNLKTLYNFKTTNSWIILFNDSSLFSNHILLQKWRNQALLSTFYLEIFLARSPGKLDIFCSFHISISNNITTLSTVNAGDLYPLISNKSFIIT